MMTSCPPAVSASPLAFSELQECLRSGWLTVHHREPCDGFSIVVRAGIPIFPCSSLLLLPSVSTGTKQWLEAFSLISDSEKERQLLAASAFDRPELPSSGQTALGTTPWGREENHYSWGFRHCASKLNAGNIKLNTMSVPAFRKLTIWWGIWTMTRQ